jgi:uncharacterized membrane protein YfcA
MSERISGLSGSRQWKQRVDPIDIIGHSAFSWAAAVALLAGFMRGFVGVGSGMLIVLAFVLLLMSGWRYRGRKRLPVTLGVGCASGVLAAATSMGNPPVIVYFLSGPDQPATNRANFTGYFALSLSTLLLLMTARGLIDAATVLRTALLLPVFAGAARLGARHFYRSTERRYRQLALGLLLAVAVYGLLR